MLTSLYIEKSKYRFKAFRFFAPFCHNSLKVEIKEVGKIKIKTIQYICRNQKVNWKKLDKVIGAQRNRLVCSNGISLPQKMGYKRFSDKIFKYRLCTNLAIWLLRNIDANVKVGVVDMDASFTPVIKHLLKYTDNVVVVTKESDIYKCVAENLLTDLGAPIRLSKSLNSLYNCDLIIAPKGIGENVSLKQDALVLSTKKPSNKTQYTVIYDYKIDLKEDIENACPKGIEKTYFASALYTLGRMFELGSIVPKICVGEKQLHTLSSLLSMCDKNLT